MPVAPAFAYIGTALGASAATATAVGVAATATVASVGLTAYSMVQSNRASKESAALARRTADYNSRVDLAEADQIELDAAANAAAMRNEASVYTSRQKAAYAASGVLSSGSPLAVQATTAGRLEQRVQQEKINASREAAKRRSAAKMGVLYGEATAKGIGRQDTVNLLTGGANILSTVGGAYWSGMLGGGNKALGPSSVGAAA